MGDNGEVTTVAASPRLDAVCAAAIDDAREAGVKVAGDVLGDHLGVSADGERVVTHSFVALQPGYRGWRWAVTVTRPPRAKSITVDEVVLLPGDEALLAPPWVPWSDRLRPGDLGVGDLLPTAPDDDRLVPGYVLSDDAAVAEVAEEIGLGRPRVMSKLGREETAERWYGGDGGPEAAMARHAPAHCGTCGFFLPLAGALRAMFGVCGNEFAPRDGQVVAADHGCGAHSQALVESPQPEPAPGPAYDDGTTDVETVATPVAEEAAENGEDLGHS
jgi:Protein of unknown function (DUF3027)